MKPQDAAVVIASRAPRNSWKEGDHLQFLSVSRSEPPHELALPGGHIEDGEDPAHAAWRELYEETGLFATKLRKVHEMTAPDGRTVHVFRCDDWLSTDAATVQPWVKDLPKRVPDYEGQRTEWVRFEKLMAQSTRFKPQLEEMLGRGLFNPPTATFHMDLGAGDVHAPGAAARMVPAPKLDHDEAIRRATSPSPATTNEEKTMADISTKTRNDMPKTEFGDPVNRKYPLPDAAHVRNAAARLAQQVKKGRVSPAEASKIHARIAAAGKKFGVEIASTDHAAMAPKSGGRPPRLSIRAHLGPGGELHVRHPIMSEIIRGKLLLGDWMRIDQGESVSPESVGVKLVSSKLQWPDGEPKQLVWTKLAETGSWKGHAAGAFSMTSQTFDQIVANFNARGLPLQFDMEHCSEQDPTSGSIPVLGTPAHGWIHKLVNRGGTAGLWGLVEWLEYAHEGIKDGKFAFLSPAVRFDCVDPVTKANIGARLTSAAITNSPFLTHLGQLRAASTRVAGAFDALGRSSLATEYDVEVTPEAVTEAMQPIAVTMAAKGLSSLVHSHHEYMPKIKAALKMDPLSHPRESADRLEMLRSCCMTAGPEGVYDGQPLAEYTRPLRDITQAAPGMSYEDMFDTVEDLIQAAIEQHDEQEHGMSPGQAAAAVHLDDDVDPGGADMSDKTKQVAAGATDAVTPPAGGTGVPVTQVAEVVTLTTRAVNAEGQVGKITLQLAERDGQVTTLTTKLSEATTQITTLSDRVKTLETEQTTNVAELVKLRAYQAETEERLLTEEVKRAYVTYKDKKNLPKNAEEGIRAMTSFARADRAGFRVMYPQVEEGREYLLRDIVPPSPSSGATQPGGTDPHMQAGPVLMSQLITKYEERGHSYAESIRMAEREYRTL